MDCKKCKKPIPDGAPFCPWCGMKQEKSAHAKQRGNGQGCAYKRGKTWTVRVILGYEITPDGKTRRVEKTKGGFKTKTDALAHVEALKIEPGKRKAPLLSSFWETYSSTSMESLSDSKRMAYNIAWNRLAKLARKPVDTITVADLKKSVANLTYYPAKDIKSILRHLFRIAGADGYANPALPDFIDLPSKTETPREPFTEAEQAQLWNSYEEGNIHANMALVMIYTGLMPGEMQSIQKPMIDLEARMIVGAGIKTSVRKKLSVVLPDAICPILEDAIKRAPTDQVFFKSEQAFYKHYYQALEIAGVRRLTPYSCRHTTATIHAISKNISPQLLTRIMRWSTSRMADRYVHPTDDDAIKAANQIKRANTDNGI